MYSSSTYTRTFPLSYSSSSSVPNYRFSTGLTSTLPRASSYRAYGSSYTSALPPAGRQVLPNVSNRPATTSSYRPSSYVTSTSSTLPERKWRSLSRSTDYIPPNAFTDKAVVWRSSSIGSGLTFRSESTSSLSSHNIESYSPRPLQHTSSYLAHGNSSPAYNGHVSRTKSRNEDKLAGRSGLYNLGNTCFMNAVLQCLCHTQPLVDYCIRGTFTADLNYRSPTGGELIKAFASLIKTLWKDNGSSTVSPDQLRRELQKYAPQFGGCSQQDAQELLGYLLQGLHDDINRVRSKADGRRQSTSNFISETQQASESWRRYQNIDDSKIVDLFGGQLKSTLKCTDCSHTSVTFDPFWSLSLPIAEGTQRPTLQQCFHMFTSPEVLDGIEKPMCEQCKKKTKSTKQFEISKFPMILVIQLKRFSSGCSYRNKLNVMVDCCKNNLDLSPFASNSCPNKISSYNLYGVVDHCGTPASGHYTAKCKNPYTGEWSEFNDTRVSNTSLSEIVTASAYLLFYDQINRTSRL